MAPTSNGAQQAAPAAHPLARERMPRWTVRSRRLRVDCSAGAVLGAAAVATGSFLAGAVLVAVCAALALWSAKPAVDQHAIEAFEREQEAKRLLARLEPELATAIQQRLGREPEPIAWDTSSSVAPPA